MLAIFLEEQIYAFSAIFGLVCIVGILICRYYMPKRTAYGAEMYAKVNGFRRFLETAEKDQIEMIGNENPHYYYDILPYMYARCSGSWSLAWKTGSLSKSRPRL